MELEGWEDGREEEEARMRGRREGLRVVEEGGRRVEACAVGMYILLGG